MDNIGPIALFILYMAISAWAKKNKAQRRAAQESAPKVETSSPKEPTFMGGIFEQLKNELLETQKDPQIIPYVEPVSEPEVELVSDDPPPQFEEGSPSFHRDSERTKVSSVAETGGVAVSPLETLLEPYSKIEQGILLHEILGKPRAYQDNEEWFHRS
ncbi:MAG: hypothetical protein U9Q77_02585 [Candidatus Marinimicrobia bacterium]|nr:hypothetical protein [Candidatus Neomarinimicrobiota bacterium]